MSILQYPPFRKYIKNITLFSGITFPITSQYNWYRNYNTIITVFSMLVVLLMCYVSKRTEKHVMGKVIVIRLLWYVIILETARWIWTTIDTQICRN